MEEEALGDVNNDGLVDFILHLIKEKQTIP
jgi:hypothetical protein